MSARRDNSEAVGWLDCARADLASARALHSIPAIPPFETCILAQQAIEKALKAVLVVEGVRVPRVHDLSAIRALATMRVALSVHNKTLDQIGDWAAKGRYPGDWLVPTSEDAVAALATAELIVAEVASRFVEESS